MVIFALIFSLFSPTEENDHILFRRIEDDLSIIEMVASKEEDSTSRQIQESVEEIRDIMSAYFFPLRIPSNERAILLVQRFFQDLYSLEKNYKKATFDHLQRTYLQIKTFVDKEQIYERKPWEKKKDYTAPKPWKRRHCQKNDLQSRPDLER